MKYAYFPGCSLESAAEEYNRSVVAVAPKLGIELEEIPDWLCCGATPAHIISHLLAVALPVSSFTWAQSQGLDVVTCCAACFARMKIANSEIHHDSKLHGEVNEAIGETYEGNVKVLHLLEVLTRDIGLEAITQKVERSLSGLKVASYYGCLLTRLPENDRIDSVEEPTIMCDLFNAMGAEAVDWPYKTECCGASLAVTQKKTVLRLARDILKTAKDSGADCVAVACPMCQSNLDLCQKDTERKYDMKFNLPVFYFTQLVGIALGLDVRAVGLEKLIVDPFPLLKEKGIIGAEIFQEVNGGY